jgi:hypothetical protein
MSTTAAGTLRIVEVVSPRDRRRFVRLARTVNRTLPLWVPMLDRDQFREIDPRANPFYRHAEAALFLALRGDRPVGRIAAIENRRHNEHWQDRIGFFGHYECLDDDEASRGLFAAAEAWLAARGLDRMRGPTNPSMNANIGFLVDGFQHPPSIPMPHTHPYYPRQAERYGLEKAMDVLVYGWHYPDYPREHHEAVLGRIARLSTRILGRRDVSIRGPRLDRVDEELALIRGICNESLKDNWGFVPLSDEEMVAARDELLEVIDPDTFSIAEVEGRPEAVFLACPNYYELLARMKGRLLPWGWLTYLRYRRRLKQYVVYVYATTPRAEALGIGVPLYERFFRECFRKGIETCETGYVLETHARMRATIENFGAVIRKRYRLFEKPIEVQGQKGSKEWKGSWDRGPQPRSTSRT